MDLSKTKYILPNLFTLSSVFAGFYSMVLTARAESARELSMAVWLIGIGMILDGCDGRVARATKTTSEFGVQLDSLADAVSFGVAPAFLVYRWGLEGMGGLGLFLAFAFAACGLMRLARFNVLAAQSGGATSSHFTGLPIPLAAGALVSVILAHLSMTGKMTTATPISAAVMTSVLALLMVSNIPYRTFKKVRMRGKTLLVLGTLLTAVIWTSVTFNTGLAFSGVLFAYVLLGIVEYVIGLGSRRNQLEEDEDALEEEVI